MATNVLELLLQFFLAIDDLSYREGAFEQIKVVLLEEDGHVSIVLRQDAQIRPPERVWIVFLLQQVRGQIRMR